MISQGSGTSSAQSPTTRKERDAQKDHPMADAIAYTDDDTTCSDPDKVGCGHVLGIHGDDADGCSYIGTGGWCGCTFVPTEAGARAIGGDKSVLNS